MYNTWMYASYEDSDDAANLAKALGIRRIKHENSAFRGARDRFVINWGSSYRNWNHVIDGSIVLNDPNYVGQSINKVRFFERMEGDKSPRCPDWTTRQGEARNWLQHGKMVIARTQIKGRQGKGIVVMKNLLDFVEAPLYTIHIPSITEYRLYMFGDDVIDAREKRQPARAKPDKDNIRIDDRGYLYYQMDNGVDDLPDDVIKQGKLAMAKTGLLFGGLDVLWDGKKAWVLEMNTAPYLGAITVRKYADAFTRYIGERQK